MTLLTACPTRLLLVTGALSVASCGHAPEQPTRQPTRQMAIALLQELDDAFNTGSVDYYQVFAPGPRKGRAFQRMRRVVEHDDRLIQASELVAMHKLDTADGEIGIAVAQTKIACAKAGMNSELHHSYRSYVAFRDTPDGPRILLFEEVDVLPDDDIVAVYKCGACNFRIGDDELQGWLVVPSPRRVSGCVEMVGFYRPGEDIQMTLSVHRSPAGKSAMTMLTGLVAKPTDAIPTPKTRTPVETWIPPFYAAAANATPAGLMGAQCELDLEGGRKTHLYLVSRHNPSGSGYPDEVCYLLSVEADPQVFAKHQMDVETWLASFQLDDAAKPSDVAGLLSASAHSGGERGPDGRSYSNKVHDFECKGPEGWQQAVRADRCVAGTSYQSPANTSYLEVSAHEYAPGTVELKKQHVFDTVSSSLVNQGFAIAEDTEWQPPQDATGGMLFWREIDSRSPAGHRMYRMLIYKDLWILVGGDVADDEAVAAYRELAASVRRR